MDRAVDEDVVDRARTGDERARQELISGHLPLVYNIVGRALNGHPDTDDVVQETMLHAVDGLPELREPGAFRSWLVAIAMNQVRDRHRAQQAAQAGGGLDEAREIADPASDFVALTIVRLGLSGQRREVAEATRWLEPAERELLALWWQEAAGELNRAELAAALELTPQHTAVRVQRAKERLDTARVVVRALAATPPAPSWPRSPPTGTGSRGRCGASGSPATRGTAPPARAGRTTSSRPRGCWPGSPCCRCPAGCTPGPPRAPPAPARAPPAPAPDTAPDTAPLTAAGRRPVPARPTAPPQATARGSAPAQAGAGPPARVVAAA